MDDPTEISGLVDEFFRSSSAPATTHQEWLLRLCAQLMHREAAVISVMEHQAAQANGWRKSRRGTRASTAASMETGARPSGAC